MNDYSTKKIKVLISPAHYYFSDKFGSEPGYSYSLVKYISQKIPNLDVIVGVIDVSEPLPRNLNIISIYKARNNNPGIELLKYLFFYPLVCLKYISLHKKYDVIHHMFPTSPKTIDPLLILVKIFSPSTKIVIGPLQLLSELNSPQDLSIMLVGKQTYSPVTFILPFIYKFLIFITIPLVRLTYNSTDIIVCNFKIIKNFYKDIFTTKIIMVIPTGVNLPKKINLKKEPRKGNVIRIISVGRLMEHKGHKYLLEAFKKLSKSNTKIELILIGEGNLKDDYLKFVKNNKLEKKVIFTGQLKRDQVEKWYKSSDIFCLPSLIDTNPAVVMEAMGFGLPVVATNVGAVAEIVDDAGLIVEKSNSDQLYAKLDQLIKDKKLRTKMGGIGFDRITRYYNWEIIALMWVNLYKELVGLN